MEDVHCDRVLEEFRLVGLVLRDAPAGARDKVAAMLSDPKPSRTLAEVSDLLIGMLMLWKDGSGLDAELDQQHAIPVGEGSTLDAFQHRNRLHIRAFLKHVSSNL